MRILSFIFSALFVSLLASCTSVSKPNIDMPIGSYYLPTKILIDRYRLIGNKDVLNIKTVSYGSVFGGWHAPIVTADYRIKPSKKDWKVFWDTLNRIGVWKWKSKYYSPRTEGWKNKIILIYPNKSLNVSIVSKNPENYTKFLNAVDQLTKYKKNSLTKKQFMEKSHKLKK